MRIQASNSLQALLQALSSEVSVASLASCSRETLTSSWTFRVHVRKEAMRHGESAGEGKAGGILWWYSSIFSTRFSTMQDLNVLTVQLWTALPISWSVFLLDCRGSYALCLLWDTHRYLHYTITDTKLQTHTDACTEKSAMNKKQIHAKYSIFRELCIKQLGTSPTRKACTSNKRWCMAAARKRK